MKMKKTVALLLALVLVLSNFSFALAEPASEPTQELSEIDLLKQIKKEVEAQRPRVSVSEYSMDPEKIVSVIVELKDEPVLEMETAARVGAAEFIQSKEGQAKVEKLESKQESLQKEIKEIASSAEFSYSYTNVINGFAMSVKAGDVKKISRLDGVKAVYKNTKYQLPSPKMRESIGIVIPDLSPTSFEYKGEKKVIAVIDTGVDVNHKVMAIKAGTGRLQLKDIEGKFNQLQAKKIMEEKGETITPKDLYKNEKFPFTFDYAEGDLDASVGDGDFDDDHGVHVSGTVAANSTEAKNQGKSLEKDDMINGVAPNAQILGMKVFRGDTAGADSAIILSAIEDAILLGADGINLSLGTTAGFSSEKDLYDAKELHYEKLFDVARAAGVSVVCAASNESRTGEGYKNRYTTNDPLVTNPDAGTVGSPSTFDNALSVAAANNFGVTKSTLTVGGSEFETKEGRYPEKGALQSGAFKELLVKKGALDFVYCRFGSIPGQNYDDGEMDKNDFDGVDVTGKIALVERGGNYFYEKVINAKEAGAIACILMNSKGSGGIIGLDLTEDLDGNLIDSDKLIPTISISYEDGEKLRKELSDKQVTDMKTESIARIMSPFSSWGCAPDLKLKPEITAPGGNIYSTISGDKYSTYNGTSMASPHVAGGTAVVSQYLDVIKWTGDKKDKALLIENILMSTATPIKDKKEGKDGVHFSPRQQGAGMMNLVAATKTKDGVTYLQNKDSNKAKVELGAFRDKTQEVTFNIINSSKTPKTYDISPTTIVEDSYKKENLQFISKNMKTAENTKYEVTFDGETQSLEDLNSITVPENSTKEVTVKFTLDDKFVTNQRKVFKYGFFVDGFVTLTSKDKGSYPDLSIPYMGFCGDWTEAPIFDTLDYPDLVDQAKKDGKTPYYTGSGLQDLNIGRMQISKLGVDLSGTKSHSKYIALSPDNDQDHDIAWIKVDMLRNARSVEMSVTNNKDNSQVATKFYDLFEITKPLKDNKAEYTTKSFYNPSGDNIISGVDGILWYGTDGDNTGKPLDEGDYTITLKATPVSPIKDSSPTTTTDEMKIPIKIDLTKPVATAVFDDEKRTITVTASDATGVDYLIVTGYVDPKGETTTSTVPFYFKNKETVTLSYDDFLYGRPYATAIAAVDAAGNMGIATDNRLKVDKTTVENKNYDGKTDAVVSAITVQSPDGSKTLERDKDFIVTAEFELKDVSTLLDVYVKVVLTEEGEKKVGQKVPESGVTKWGDILPAELTLKSAKITPKVYDGNTSATLEDITLAGVAAGETLEFKKDFDATAEFDSPDASPTAPATVKITLNEESMVTYNYKIKNAEEKTTGLISPQKIKISSAKVEDKTYDGTTDAIVSAVGFSPDLKFVADKDYEAKGIFAGSDAGENVDATVTVTMKNTNYEVDGPFTTKATIHKAERTVKLAYTIKPVNGQYVVIIEKVAGALYNFGDGWTDKNEFTAAKGSNLQLGIRLPEDKNYKESSAKINITVEATGDTPLGDNTNILIWIGLLAFTMGIMMFTQQSRKSKFEL